MTRRDFIKHLSLALAVGPAIMAGACVPMPAHRQSLHTNVITSNAWSVEIGREKDLVIYLYRITPEWKAMASKMGWTLVERNPKGFATDGT